MEMTAAMIKAIIRIRGLCGDNIDNKRFSDVVGNLIKTVQSDNLIFSRECNTIKNTDSFKGHAGRPGKRGGSLPKGAYGNGNLGGGNNGSTTTSGNSGMAARTGSEKSADLGAGGGTETKRETGSNVSPASGRSVHAGSGKQTTSNGGNNGTSGERDVRRNLKSVNSETYSAAMNTFVEHNTNAGMVDLHSPADWDGSHAKMFLGGSAETGYYGAAVKPNGDVVGVFCDTRARGGGKHAMLTAIENGGDRLDAYAITPDGTPSKLAEFYHKSGFEPVIRVKYIEKYADPSVPGNTDIVAYRHNGDSAETVAKNYGKYAPPAKEQYGALPVMDYDEAIAYRDSLMDKK